MGKKVVMLTELVQATETSVRRISSRYVLTTVGLSEGKRWTSSDRGITPEGLWGRVCVCVCVCVVCTRMCVCAYMCLA